MQNTNEPFLPGTPLRFGGTSVGLGVDGAEGFDAEGGIRACEAAGESGEEGEVAGKNPTG